MENNELTNIKRNTFKYLDDIKKNNPRGFEYWHARDLQKLLEYIEWRSFKDAINRAKMACESSGGIIKNHFGDSHKMVSLGSGTSRKVEDIVLTRYACYLIAMNGDPSKPTIAAVQSYFAVQTRKQELAEQRSDDEDRILLRNRVRDANKDLNQAASEAGVENYAFFHNAGYKGLYGGLGLSEIKRKKGIDQKEDLLDRSGRAELAANEFRITQTELRLINQEVNSQKQAEEVHNYVGKEVRQTIEKLSGTMPEDLKPEPSIKKIKKQKQKEITSD